MVKLALDKQDRPLSIESRIAKVLVAVHNTHYVTTGKTPAKLLLKRSPQTCLSLIHPYVDHEYRMQTNAEQAVGDHQSQKFKEGQLVTRGVASLQVMEGHIHFGLMHMQIFNDCKNKQLMTHDGLANIQC